MEAAIIFPIVILVVFLLMKTGIKLYEKTGRFIAEDGRYSQEILNPGFPAEGVLRLKWMGENYLFGSGD